MRRERDALGGDEEAVLRSVEAVGLARAKGFEAQKEALGPEATAMVNTISELVKSASRFVPDILVTGTNGSGDVMSAGVMGFLREFQRQRGGTPHVER